MNRVGKAMGQGWLGFLEVVKPVLVGCVWGDGEYGAGE
jgi:hypothetical protein